MNLAKICVNHPVLVVMLNLVFFIFSVLVECLIGTLLSAYLIQVRCDPIEK